MRDCLYYDMETRKDYPIVDLLFGMEGPLWYRGMVRPGENEYYTPIDEKGVTDVLTICAADRLFVGHTIFDEICSFFDGRVIDVNVDNARNRQESKSRGVAVENGELFLLFDDPQAKRLWNPVTETNRQIN
ncbi:MAG: hypothetical protein LUF87_02275 [Alistipes sp.]|nr:hypothetical protein [Alistipes sp.]